LKLCGLVLLAVLAVSLAGCGRRGPLELPPGASSAGAVPLPADPEANAGPLADLPPAPSKGQDSNQDSGQTSADQPPRQKPAKRSFLLDPML
jgi:predicted small lipoprotein YifL